MSCRQANVAVFGVDDARLGRVWGAYTTRAVRRGAPLLIEYKAAPADAPHWLRTYAMSCAATADGGGSFGGRSLEAEACLLVDRVAAVEAAALLRAPPLRALEGWTSCAHCAFTGEPPRGDAAGSPLATAPAMAARAPNASCLRDIEPTLRAWRRLARAGSVGDGCHTVRAPAACPPAHVSAFRHAGTVALI